MTVFTASTTAQLTQALNSAHAGDVVQLEPGAYSAVLIRNYNFSSAVTITSADPSNPAVLTDMKVYSSTGIQFDQLEFSTAGAPVGKWGAEATIQFQFQNDTNVSITNSNLHGDPNGTLATDVTALIFQNCNGVLVNNCSFQHFHNAINDLNCNNFTVSNNTFIHIWDDGVRGGGTSNALITGNSFTDMHENAADPDHPDCIQFWTTNTTTSAQNITITNNTYTRGDGNPVQGIFVNDEVGNLPYQNVTISGNTMAGTLWNGITLNDGQNSTISNNTILSYTGQTSWFRVTNCNGVSVLNNAAVQYLYTNDQNMTVSGNVINSPVPPPNAHVFISAIAGLHDGALADSGLHALSGGGQAFGSSTAAARLFAPH